MTGELDRLFQGTFICCDRESTVSLSMMPKRTFTGRSRSLNTDLLMRTRVSSMLPCQMPTLICCLSKSSRYFPNCLCSSPCNTLYNTINSYYIKTPASSSRGRLPSASTPMFCSCSSGTGCRRFSSRFPSATRFCSSSLRSSSRSPPRSSAPELSCSET